MNLKDRFCSYCGNKTKPMMCMRCNKHFGGICKECPATGITMVFDENGDFIHICSDLTKEDLEKYKLEH